MAYIDNYNRSIDVIEEDIFIAEMAYDLKKGRYQHSVGDDVEVVLSIFNMIENPKRTFIKGDMAKGMLSDLKRLNRISDANERTLRELISLKQSIAQDKKTLKEEKEHLGIL